MNSNPVTALRHAEASLVKQIHATADAVDRIGTESVEGALQRLGESVAEAQERIRSAMLRYEAMLGEAAASLDLPAQRIEVDVTTCQVVGVPAPVGRTIAVPELGRPVRSMAEEIAERLRDLSRVDHQIPISRLETGSGKTESTLERIAHGKQDGSKSNGKVNGRGKK